MRRHRSPDVVEAETRERAARTGRNPQTGEEIAIAASTSVGFKAAAQLKRAVNG